MDDVLAALSLGPEPEFKATSRWIANVDRHERTRDKVEQILHGFLPMTSIRSS